MASPSLQNSKPSVTDLPTPPPLAPAQQGVRRSNLVRNPLDGRIVKNDRKKK